jgi:mono/diheme cytochrome c family protein
MQNNDYNRGGYIAFLFSMAFSLAFFIYVTAFHPGINLKEIPEAAAGGEQAVAAFDASKVAKPWEQSEEMVNHGAKVFATNCAVRA